MSDKKGRGQTGVTTPQLVIRVSLALEDDDGIQECWLLAKGTLIC